MIRVRLPRLSCADLQHLHHSQKTHVEGAGELVGPCALRGEGTPDPDKLMLEAGDLGFERAATSASRSRRPKTLVDRLRAY